MTDQPAKVDLETPDVAEEKRAAFAELLPGVLADGVLDAARLGALLDTDVAGLQDGRERYGLMWAGKQEAVRCLLKPSRGTLVPDLDNSVHFDSAENVFIEGDNLEVLKLLQKAYNDRVKLIYIDPPYNTGNDFVYNDDFTDGLRGYLEYTGQLDESGNRTSTNIDVAGRRHSRWLSMMYPRLMLARNLLCQDGVIFISIDDNEVGSLRLVCDEVFGPENFIENYVWESNFRPDNSSKVERENSQHVLCYGRRKKTISRLIGAQKKTDGLPSLTKNSMGISTVRFRREWVDLMIPDGKYAAGQLGSGYRLEEDVVVVGGAAQNDFSLSGRIIWSQKYLEYQAAAGTRIVIKGAGFVPYSRKAETSQLAPTSLIPRDIVGDVLAGNAEMRSLLGDVIFNHPKPTSLIRYLAASVTHDDKCATILDFFTGSGSTAHAVALLNAADGGHRRCISVNLPEPTTEGSVAAEAGYQTVSEITRARIKAVMESVEGADKQGLRTLTLAESNFAGPGSGDPETLLDLQATTLRDEEPHLDALAAEILLKEGVPLDVPWERKAAGDAEVVLAGGVAVVLTTVIDEAVTQEALQLEPRVLVFLEDGFEGVDAIKANVFYACQQAGVILKTV